MYAKVMFVSLLTVMSIASANALGSPAELPDAVTDDDYYDRGAPPTDKVELGRMLFFDRELRR